VVSFDMVDYTSLHSEIFALYTDGFDLLEVRF